MKHFAVVVLVVLLVTACAGQYHDPRLSVPDDAEERDSAPTELSRTVPISEDGHLDTERPLRGQLAFMRDDDLLLATFDGTPATVIAEGVEVWDVSPGGEMVMYFNPRDEKLYGLAVATGETWPITWQYPLGSILLGPWSADGRWIIVQNATVDGHVYEQMLVGVDGGIVSIPPPEVWLVNYDVPDVPEVRLDPVPLERFRILHWLRDGRLIVLLHDFERQYNRIAGDFVDPESGIITPVGGPQSEFIDGLHGRMVGLEENAVMMKPYVLAYVEEHFSFRLSFGPEHVIGTTAYDSEKNFAVMQTVEGQTTCKVMHLSLQPVREAFFPVDFYVAVVADAAPLVLRADDPAVVSVQTIAPNCDDTQAWQRVVRVSLEEPYRSETLFRTDELAPGIPAARVAQTHETAVVIWSTRSVAEERASLLLTDVVTGETEEFLAARYNSVTNTGGLDVLAWSW